MTGKHYLLCCVLQSLLPLLPAAAPAANGGRTPAPQEPVGVEIYPWNCAHYSDADLRTLEHDRVIEVLPLSNCKITDAGLEYLKGMKRLKELSLNNTRITDDGLRKLQLQSHPDLEDLRIARTGVTDAGLVYVGRMTTLCGLELNDQTSDAGLRISCR